MTTHEPQTSNWRAMKYMEPPKKRDADGFYIQYFVTWSGLRSIGTWWTWNGKDWGWDIEGEWLVRPEPTHWMPLPPLPEEADDE